MPSFIRLLAAGLGVALALGGCTRPPSDGRSVLVSCAEARTAADCGGLTALAHAAAAEGTLLLPGSATSDSQFGALAEAFAKEYDLEVTWTEHQGDSEDGTDAVLLEPGSALPATEQVAPYRVQSFAKLPAAARQADGEWSLVYTAVMAVGYDASALGELDSLAELQARTEAKIGWPGDPQTSVAAAHALLMLDARTGARVAGDGVEQLADWATDGRLSRTYATIDSLAAGKQDVAPNWNTVQRARAEELAGNGIDWRYFVPAGAEVSGSWGVAVSGGAAHPAAARLWVEYCLSSAAQVAVLRAGGMPTLYHYLQSLGDLDNSAGTLPFLAAPPWTPRPADVADVRARALPVWPDLFG